MSQEFFRKGIHLASLSIPIIYSFVDRSIALWLVIPFTIFSLLVDFTRHYVPAVKKVVNVLFDSMLREHERDETKLLLSGATYVLLSASFCILLFPKLVMITAFSVLIVSDAMSALVGRAFGKHKFLDKSLEGSLAFILSGWIVVALAPKASTLGIEFMIGFIAVILGAIVEAASVRLRLDDNFSVPAVVGLTLWAMYYGLTLVGSEAYNSMYEGLLRFV